MRALSVWESPDRVSAAAEVIARANIITNKNLLPIDPPAETTSAQTDLDLEVKVACCFRLIEYLFDLQVPLPGRYIPFETITDSIA